jgi:hypothetical protein
MRHRDGNDERSSTRCGPERTECIQRGDRLARQQPVRRNRDPRCKGEYDERNPADSRIEGEGQRVRSSGIARDSCSLQRNNPSCCR